jgi:Uma2 family endonuclease
MSTVPKPQRPRKPKAAADPFRYGWRYVEKKGSNGRVEFDQIPLTVEDVLHPEEGDVILESDEHDNDCVYLKTVFKARLAHDGTAVVLSDCRVAWDVPGVRPHGPDITVVCGVRQHKPWSTFDVAQEGVRPQLVMEITSPETRDNDLKDKRREYYRAGVEYYVIVDQYSHRGGRKLRLLGYRRGKRGYEKLPLSPEDRLWLPPVELWLGIEDGRVVCYTPQGERIGDYTEIDQARQAEAQARQAAEQQAQAEAQARQAAEQQARAEAEARAAAEERIRELEAQLRRQRPRR